MDEKTKAGITMTASLAAMIVLACLLIAETPSDYLLFQIIIILILFPIMLLGIYMMITGKGSSLIAGFNTSPPKVKASYDSEALSKAVGAIVFIMLAMLLILMESIVWWFNTIFVILMIILFIVFTIASLIYINKSDRFRKDPGEPIPEMTESERKRSKKITIAALSVTAVILVAVFGVIFLYGDVSADIEEDRLTVNAPMMNETISYSDITAYYIDDDLDTGTRTDGWGSFKIQSGKFNNDEFGSYKRASYTDVKTYIVIEYGGGHLAFNLDSVEKTQQAFDDLTDKITADTGLLPRI